MPPRGFNVGEKKVILLELNELCPPLLEKFIKAGELPNFAKIYDGSVSYTTEATCDPEFLEPWIQWVTLHTGQPFEKHKIFRLGQAQTLTYQCIWDVLSKHGKSSWLCGSMNVKWDAKDKKITVLPDPWSVDVSASPKELQPFYNFVRANVQEHTNDNYRLSLADNLNFLLFMLRHGLSAKTIGKLCKTVIRQLTKSEQRWKKATVLDWLQFDVFAHVYKKNKPAFATFFSNSTAHFQHKYWRYMEPEKFPLKPSAKEKELYGDAVLFAYKNHDALIGEALKLADENTVIMLSSALSQQPFTAKDEEGGKRFYRPHDMSLLPEIIGLTGVNQVNPVMSHQFQILCNSTEDAQNNYDVLKAIKFEDKELFSLTLEGTDVFGGCSVFREVSKGSIIQLRDKTIPFTELFYLADSLKSGMHHPQGIFWIYNNNSDKSVSEHRGLLNLEQVMGLILSEYSLSI